MDQIIIEDVEHLKGLCLSVLSKMVTTEANTLKDIAQAIYEDQEKISKEVDVTSPTVGGIYNTLEKALIPYLLHKGFVKQEGTIISLTYKGIKGGNFYNELLNKDIVLTKEEYFKEVDKIFNDSINSEVI